MNRPHGAIPMAPCSHWRWYHVPIVDIPSIGKIGFWEHRVNGAVKEAMSRAQLSASESQPERSQRFAIRAPISYRISGESTWRDGITENISRSGMLFRAERLLKHGTKLELNLGLPVKLPREPAPDVIFHGSVVRVASAPGDKLPAWIAAKILDYRLLRRGGVPQVPWKKRSFGGYAETSELMT